jgi:tripartite-type tricarboxylate transporter receptor subunit TctC
MPSRKLCTIASALVLVSLGFAVHAAEWPARPVRIVVPAAAGGGTDLIARLIADKLRDGLQQPVVIENKPGADEIIGAEFVARSPADGYTLLFSAANIVVNPSLRSKLPFDPHRDFQPIAKIATLPFVLIINPKLPAKTLPELVAHSQKGDGLNAAIGGTANMLVTELFKLQTNAKLKFIPYKGCGPATQSVLAGETDLAFCSAPALAQFVLAGRLTALAVTGDKRLSMLPNVPTGKEVGGAAYDVDLSQWVGAFFPANTPADISARLNAEINKALAAPDVIAKIGQLGAETTPGSVDEFAQFYRGELAKFRELVTRARIPVEN